MRRTAGAIAVIVAAGLLIAPGTLVEGVINPPDLSWIQPGHTFYYEASNPTDAVEFSVTIDDVTGDTVALVYWTSEAEGTEWVASNDVSESTKEYLDVGGFYTALWINHDDLIANQVSVDDRVFLFENDLDTTTHKFVNGNTAFYYDHLKGWLTRADYGDSNRIIELLNVADLGDHAPPDDVVWDPNIDCPNGWSNPTNDADGLVSTYVFVALCYRTTILNGQIYCEGQGKAVARVRFPLWDIDSFEWRYSLKILSDGELVGSKGGQFGDGYLPLPWESTLVKSLPTVLASEGPIYEADAKFNKSPFPSDLIGTNERHRCGG